MSLKHTLIRTQQDVAQKVDNAIRPELDQLTKAEKEQFITQKIRPKL